MLTIPSKDYGNKPYLYVSLARICLQLKEYYSGIKYIEKFMEDLSDFTDLYFLEAALYAEMMMFSKSLD